MIFWKRIVLLALLIIDGTPKEKGKIESKYEEVFGIDVKFYNGTVDFVQIVKLKKNVKTTVSGTIEYMVCNDKECMPPQTISFSVKLE